MKYKYAVYCSGNASRIIKFYSEYSVHQFNLDLVVYDGNNDNSKLELKKLFQDKLYIYNHNSQISNRLQSEVFSNFLLDILNNMSIDYVFCFGNKILKKPLLNYFKNKIINFHPSLLPSYPGLNAIDQALKGNAEIIGNTAHFIDEGIDTGPIIIQSKINKANYTTYDSVLDLQLDMLFLIWSKLENDQIHITDNNVKLI